MILDHVQTTSENVTSFQRPLVNQHNCRQITIFNWETHYFYDHVPVRKLLVITRGSHDQHTHVIQHRTWVASGHISTHTWLGEEINQVLVVLAGVFVKYWLLVVVHADIDAG